MPIGKRFWLLLASAGFLACGSSSSSKPVAASARADGVAELIEIPAELCPAMANYFAISPEGVKAILRQEIQTETQHAIDLEKCNGAAAIERSRRESAEAALAHAQWWERWGPLVAAIGTTAGLVLGIAGGWGFGHTR